MSATHPRNSENAYLFVHNLIIDKSTKISHGVKKKQAQLAGAIAVRIFKRYQVGNAGLKKKHLMWLLQENTEIKTCHSQYDDWRAIRVYCTLTKRKHWIPYLSGGPWVRPTGVKGKLSKGRPPGSL